MNISRAIAEIEDEIERVRPTFYTSKKAAKRSQAYIQGLMVGLDYLKGIREEFEEWLNQ